MRNKSPLAPELRDYIAWRLKYYREDKAQLAEMVNDMIPSAIPNYEPKTGGFNSEQRPTEDISIRIANDEYIQALRVTVNAIEAVINHLTAEDKELLRLTYWNGELTADGIAMRLNMSTRTYYNHLNSILVAIAIKMGLCKL